MAQTQINGATQIRSESIIGNRIAANTVGDDRLESLYIYANGARAFTGDIDLDGYRITYVGDPQDSSDAANKAYVDGLIQGFDWKQSVRVATIEHANLSSSYSDGDTVDGVTLAVGDRILIKDQSNASENGIYVVNLTGAPTRSNDFDSNSDATTGVTVFVSEGDTNANSAWSIGSNDPLVLGTDDIYFVQVGGGSLYKAGDGLVLSGSTFNVQAADATITVNGDDIQVGIDDASLEVGDDGLRVKQGTAGQVYVANAQGVLTPVTLSGDVSTVTDDGEVTLVSNVLKATNYITREIPSGAVNGTNATYTLAAIPVAGSESVFLNGILQDPGAGNDYTISDSTITFADAPVVGDKIRVSYIK